MIKIMNRAGVSFVSLGLAGLLVVALIVVAQPLSVEAATYAYVNTAGNIAYVTADTSSGAMAAATNLAIHSGVMLVSNTSANLGNSPVVVVDPGQTSTEPKPMLSGYAYVNTSGQVVHVNATSAAGAFAVAVNIAPHSGVMLINSLADSQLVGNSVVVN